MREEVLRIIGPALLVSLALGSVTFGEGAAYAAWAEHPYKDLGFVVEFPNPPATSNGNYRTHPADAPPVHIYSQKQGNALFIASITDLQKQAADGASLMTEAEFNLALIG